MSQFSKQEDTYTNGEFIIHASQLISRGQFDFMLYEQIQLAS
ncbi:unnamed protein product, partial (macronuclear) [Paramecium tetraurelia]